MFRSTDLDIIQFCAKECTLQQSGEMSVARMIEAWNLAQSYSLNACSNTITTDRILSIGTVVDPRNYGWRQVNVQVGNEIINWENIPSQMFNLVEAQGRLTPGEFFYEFEKIHPFIDGNGRTGQILFNWLGHTLDDPVFAPDFFGQRS